MTQASNDFDDNRILDFIRWVETLDQFPETALIELIGQGDDVNQIFKRRVRYSIIVRLQA